MCVKCQTVTGGFTPGETSTRLTRQDEGCMKELVFSPQNDCRVTPSIELILISVRLPNSPGAQYFRLIQSFREFIKVF